MAGYDLSRRTERCGVSRAQAVAGVPIALAMARGRFAKLRRVRPRPYALADVPPDMPPVLSSESYGPELTDIVLAYGHPHKVSKPLNEVNLGVHLVRAK